MPCKSGLNCLTLNLSNQSKSKKMAHEKIFESLELTSVGLHKKAVEYRLSREICDLENTCGSCQKFMTKQCPWEAKMKRRTIDPKCSEFELSPSAFHAIEKRQKHLSQI